MVGWAAAAAGAGAVWAANEVLLGRGVMRALRAAAADQRSDTSSGPGPEVSIVVCIRNGADEVEAWAEAVRACRGVAFEVVAVDDGSSDSTPDRLVAAAARWEPGRFRFVRVEGTAPGKREALAAGVEAARAEVVLATDIDCRPLGPTWVEAMTEPLRRGRADVVAGVCLPVLLAAGEGRNLAGWMQLADDLRIARSYVAAAGLGWPYMTVGRNVAFRRELALAVKAPPPPGVASGDDDLAFQAWLRARPGLRVLADPRPEASAATRPAPTVAAWARRKRRHLTTAPHYPPAVLLRLAVSPTALATAAGCAAAAIATAPSDVVHTALGIVAGAVLAAWLVQTFTLQAFARTAGLNGRAVCAGAAMPAVAGVLRGLVAIAAVRAGLKGRWTPTEPLKSTRRRPAVDPWT